MCKSGWKMSSAHAAAAYRRVRQVCARPGTTNGIGRHFCRCQEHPCMATSAKVPTFGVPEQIDHRSSQNLVDSTEDEDGEICAFGSTDLLLVRLLCDRPVVRSAQQRRQQSRRINRIEHHHQRQQSSGAHLFLYRSAYPVLRKH
jgi:hypothetical protein